MKFLINSQDRGFSLIEIILTLAILSFVFFFNYQIYNNIQQVVLRSKIYLTILSILQDEIEKIRVMNYEDIGIIDGWPRGILPREKIIEKENLEVLVRYYVRNIDDPKDGTITSTPRDTAPADYKLIELEGQALNSLIKTYPQKLTAIIAPKTLETITNNGSLFIKVINSRGNPVNAANIKVDYLGNPSFTIEDLTDVNGELRLIDIPPGINIYRIYVTKQNFSRDRTYPPGDPQNPNPVLPDQTVKRNEVTFVTFQIDKLSLINLNFFDKLCRPFSQINFGVKGEKLIGVNPDVLKTKFTTTTDANGQKSFYLEWDNYEINLTDNNLVFLGMTPYLRPRFIVEPDKVYNLNLTLASSSPINLLVTVLDNNRNYLEDAEVKLIDQQNRLILKRTGEESVFDDNWNNQNYSEISAGIETELYPGEIRLKDIGGSYPTSTEFLISKTIDFGTSTIFYKKFVFTGNIPPETSIKFQVAANNDNSTWNFVGPDGTENSFFETQEFSLPGFLVNKRYFRYKVYLKTNDPSITPSLDKITIFYYSSCLSSGQVLFQNLTPGSYILEVNKQNYGYSSQNLNLSSSELYKEIEVILSP